MFFVGLRLYLISALLALSACAGTGTSETIRETVSADFGCLKLKLTAPSTTEVGEGLMATLALSNECDEVYEFELAGNPAHDLLVTGASEEVFWRWTGYLPVESVIQRKALAPGDALIYEMTWDGNGNGLEDGVPFEGGPVPPGRYLLKGIVFTTTDDLSVEMSLNIHAN